MATTKPVKPKSWSEVKESRADINKDRIYKMEVEYDYPRGLDLRPGSKLSDYLCEQVHRRCQASRSEQDRYVGDMQKMDEVMTAFMPADDIDKEREANDARKPTVVVHPMSFAARARLNTYLTSVYFKGGPPQRYQGMGGPKDLVCGAINERLAMRQALWFNQATKWTPIWGQGFTYGSGFGALRWEKKKARKRVQEQVSDTLGEILGYMGVKKADIGTVMRGLQEQTLQEGTAIEPIDRYQVFLDPTVPPENVQDMEYFGWIYRTNAKALLRREFDPEERLFNCEQACEACGAGRGTSTYWSTSNRRDRHGRADLKQGNDDVQEVIDVITMIIDIIPSQWKLGPENYPVLYLVSIACDDIVIQCDELDLDHGMKPVVGVAPASDGFSSNPISQLQAIYNLQQQMSWSLKSIYDFRNTILNGIIFYDPDHVNEEYLMNPGHGKLVPVESGAYGEGGIGRFVHQFQVQDVTQGNMGMVGDLDSIANNFLGFNKIAMGDFSESPERMPKAGIAAAQNAMFGLLESIAVTVDEQCMRPAAHMIRYNNRQLLSAPVLVGLVGRYEQEMRALYGIPADHNGFHVTPYDLDGDVEVVPVTENLPGLMDATGASEVLKTLFANGAGEQIVQDYDIGRIFEMVARKALGFESISEFRRRASTDGVPVQLVHADDETVRQQMQAGNIVPVGTTA